MTFKMENVNFDLIKTQIFPLTQLIFQDIEVMTQK